MSAPTRAGRALRRGLLKGCVVVIVVAGYSGKRFIYERAHELGIRRGAHPAPLLLTRPLLAEAIKARVVKASAGFGATCSAGKLVMMAPGAAMQGHTQSPAAVASAPGLVACLPAIMQDSQARRASVLGR